MGQFAQIFGIIINVAILLVFFRFLMQLAAVSPITLWFWQQQKQQKLSISLAQFSQLWRRLSEYCSFGVGGDSVFVKNVWFDVFVWRGSE